MYLEILDDLKKYISTCSKVDKVLEDLDMKKICAQCSKGELKDLVTGRKTKGCCYGCKYLGKDGCTTMALFCKKFICTLDHRCPYTVMPKKDSKKFKELVKPILNDLSSSEGDLSNIYRGGIPEVIQILIKRWRIQWNYF